ncbi:MAG: nucleotide disphospho-sugar-binding domain-containing protein [Steroidobacteraceae bacterium]
MPMSRKKRSHAAFFVFPEFADTVPTLSVVSTLVRRGYRVSYVTTDRFASSISELGAEFVRCPSYMDFAQGTSDGNSPRENPFVPLTANTLSAITPFYEENRPDIIIHDTVGFAGRILAKKWDIPSIQVSCDFRMDRRYPSRQAPEFYNAVLGGVPSYEQLLASYGIVGDGFLFSRGELNIYFYPNIFQLDGNAFDESSFYAGRCAPERPYTGKWRPKDAGNQRIVLVSASTLFVQGPEYFEMCIEALADLQWHVILNIGENNDPATFGAVPAQFEIIQGKPQIGVLPYADLLICAGGMMTTVESMYCGVPLLMMTHGNVELEAYAENGVRLGLGRHLKKAEANAETIRESLLQMSEDTALRGRVMQAQRLVRAEPGAEEVANRIGEYVESFDGISGEV